MKHLLFQSNIGVVDLDLVNTEPPPSLLSTSPPLTNLYLAHFVLLGIYLYVLSLCKCSYSLYDKLNCTI